MKKINIYIFLFFFPCILYAQSYHWVENGIHYFSNFQTPPAQKDEIVPGTITKDLSAAKEKDKKPSKEPLFVPANIFPPGKAKKVIGKNKIPVKRKVSLKEKSRERIKALKQKWAKEQKKLLEQENKYEI